MLISIIIPIYNTQEAKLRKCLDSIINQDYTDYECLMIDDGSKADTSFIVDKYAERDKRFFAIHKDNGGVSSARNKGLELAKGEWICFVDSDDWVKKNHLSSFINAIDDNIDLLLCGFEDVYIENTEIHHYDDLRYLNKEGFRKFLSETDVLWYMIPWDRMFRTSVIKEYNIRFNEGLPISEDRLFCYDYFLHTRGIATISAVTYVHDATDNTSLSRKPVSLDIQKKRFTLMSKAKRKLFNKFQMNKKDAIKLCSYNENLLVTMLNSGVSFLTLITLIKYDALLVIKLIIKKYATAASK